MHWNKRYNSQKYIFYLVYFCGAIIYVLRNVFGLFLKYSVFYTPLKRLMQYVYFWNFEETKISTLIFFHSKILQDGYAAWVGLRIQIRFSKYGRIRIRFLKNYRIRIRFLKNYRIRNRFSKYDRNWIRLLKIWSHPPQTLFRYAILVY